MEISALSFQLLADVFVLMAVRADHSNFAGAVFLRIVPNKLQFTEYESISARCEAHGSTAEWSVKWKPHKTTNSSHTSNTSASPCTINPTFERHSGEYWCENEGGERSGAVNITVTAAFVILDGPVQPAMEGSEVNLKCSNKKTQSEHIADFYKDGVLLSTSYKNSLTIQNVSKTDEGFYRCSISGAGESPESWITVLKQNEAPYKETLHLSHLKIVNLLWTVACVLLVDLLLLVMGTLLCRKCKEPERSRAPTSLCLQGDNVIYSSVTYRPLIPE